MPPRRSERTRVVTTRTEDAQNDPSTSRSRSRRGRATAASPRPSPRRSPYPSPSRQDAPASQQAEAQAQPPAINVDPPTAQTTTSHLHPPPQLSPDQQRIAYLERQLEALHPPQLTPDQQRIAHLERQLEALQQSLATQGPSVSPVHLHQPHYALGALSHAPVAPPQGPSDQPRLSFLNTQGENRISESIFTKFPYVKRKLVEDIWHNRLSLEGFQELASDPLPHLDTGELPKFREMLRGFEVYSQIVCWFAGHEAVPDLYDAFSTYRLQLLSFLGTYTLDSVRTFHHTFVRIRLPLRQDDPMAWATRVEQIERTCLVTRTNPSRERISSTSRPFKTWSPNVCRAWNENKPCRRLPCSYEHKCNTCAGTHPMTMCSSPTSGPNSDPLRSRPPARS